MGVIFAKDDGVASELAKDDFAPARMMCGAWGKTDQKNATFHPLAHHCMDVAAVFARMVELPVVRSRLETGSPANAGINPRP